MVAVEMGDIEVVHIGGSYAQRIQPGIEARPLSPVAGIEEHCSVITEKEESPHGRGHAVLHSEAVNHRLRGVGEQARGHQPLPLVVLEPVDHAIVRSLHDGQSNCDSGFVSAFTASAGGHRESYGGHGKYPLHIHIQKVLSSA